jgi:hypothetical protein
VARDQHQTLQDLFAVNRRLAKTYLFRDQLMQLWTYTYEANARLLLTTWCLALRWQRLPAFETLAKLLLAYCHVKVPFGVAEAINGNIRAVLYRGGATAITRSCSSRCSG